MLIVRAGSVRAARGFSIIELAVVMAIIAVLMAMGLPAFGTYLQNGKIAGAAKSIFSGVQSARTEAIRRNLPVEFMLTSTAVSADMAAAAVASTTGRNWVIRFADPEAENAYAQIEARAAVEGSGQAADSTPTVGVASSASTIRFNGLGGMFANTAVTINIINSAGGDCAAQGGPMRCQRVVVSPGGQVRLCDPAVEAAASSADSRACPPTVVTGD